MQRDFQGSLETTYLERWRSWFTVFSDGLEMTTEVAEHPVEDTINACIGVGKTTTTCRNRAYWHMWMKETSQQGTPLGCGTQGYRQPVHSVGRKPYWSGGKPWEAAAGGCTTYWEMDCLWERGRCTFLRITFCFSATSLTQPLKNRVCLPRPTRRSYSFPSYHQHSPEWDNG